MFKEPEAGKKDINIERTEEALSTGAQVIAVGCPFCLTMMTDGVKNKNREAEIPVYDLAEMLAKGMGI
jgi:Fe-S oxidoreductase